jgi:hypothetical protein
MSPSIPNPRDGAAPLPAPSSRVRPWPTTRRVALTFAAAMALVLIPSGVALACTTPPPPPPPPTPPCAWHHHPGCKPIVPPTKPPTKPPITRPITPPTTPPTAPPTAPPTTPPTKSVPSKTPSATASKGTCVEGTSGGDTCHVVTGSPSFTG